MLSPRTRLAIGLLLLLLTGCVDGDGDKAAAIVPTPSEPCRLPSCTEITVIGIDYAFAPPAIEVPAGKVRFVLKNQGKFVHNFRILGGGFDQKTPNLAPGAEGFVDVTLPARKFDIYCSITGHAERGMRGTLEVK